MNLSLISVPCVGASTEPTGKSAGLARAADAYVDAGLLEEFAVLGVGVKSSARPVLPGEKLSLDPIVNLGRYNALVAKAVVDGLAGTQLHVVALAGVPDGRLGLFPDELDLSDVLARWQLAVDKQSHRLTRALMLRFAN